MNKKKYLPKKIKKIYDNEFYYLLGVMLGDGFLLHNKKGRAYSINLKTTDKQFIEKFKENLEKYTQYPARIYKEKNKSCKKNFNYRIRFISKELYYFLKEERKMPLINPPSTKKEIIYFLRGLYDSEGFAHKTLKKIGFYSTKEQIIILTKNNLEILNINSIIWETKKNNKPYYELNIFKKENLVRFNQLIGFTSNFRKERLSNLINTYLPIIK